MIQVSIIIPHYNSPILLERLLDTIPIKEDIEIIVVDDKSDTKLQELNFLVNNPKYNHVSFFKNTTEKKGAGVCRNIGLEKARGKWVLFADSDDFFAKAFYEIISKYFSFECDIIFFNTISFFMDTGKKADRHKIYQKLVLDYIGKKDFESEVLLRYCFTSPCSKLIRRSLLIENNIFFDEVIASNDVMFSTKVGYFAKRIYATDEIIYCITVNTGSLTTNRSEIIFDSRLYVFIDYCNFVRSHLKKKELEVLNITGSWLFLEVMKYELGFKKMLFVCRKLKKNQIQFLNSEFLNPLHTVPKIINYYTTHKRNKKYSWK